VLTSFNSPYKFICTQCEMEAYSYHRSWNLQGTSIMLVTTITGISLVVNRSNDELSQESSSQFETAAKRNIAARVSPTIVCSLPQRRHKYPHGSFAIRNNADSGRIAICADRSLDEADQYATAVDHYATQYATLGHPCLTSNPWFADVLSHQLCVDANLGMLVWSWKSQPHRRKELKDYASLCSY
jgi:hypothetical protein